MTRAEAIEKLKSYDPMSMMPAIQMAIQALEEPQWIPCSERLPETNKWRTTFNVTTDNGKVMSMEWENTTVRNKPVSRWVWQDRLSPWKVIAWMSLPEPWKG